jgi:hypothetical protein
MVEEPFGVTVCGDKLQPIPTGSAGQVKFAARLNLFWGETVTWSVAFWMRVMAVRPGATPSWKSVALIATSRSPLVDLHQLRADS